MLSLTYVSSATDLLEPEALAGYNDFLQQPAAADLAEQGPAAYQLLKVFGDSMR